MFYKTQEVSDILRYECPKAFLIACKEQKSELIKKILTAKFSEKVGKNILWNKKIIDEVLAAPISELETKPE